MGIKCDFIKRLLKPILKEKPLAQILNAFKLKYLRYIFITNHNSLTVDCNRLLPAPTM